MKIKGRSGSRVAQTAGSAGYGFSMVAGGDSPPQPQFGDVCEETLKIAGTNWVKSFADNKTAKKTNSKRTLKWRRTHM